MKTNLAITRIVSNSIWRPILTGPPMWSFNRLLRVPKKGSAPDDHFRRIFLRFVPRVQYRSEVYNNDITARMLRVTNDLFWSRINNDLEINPDRDFGNRVREAFWEAEDAQLVGFSPVWPPPRLPGSARSHKSGDCKFRDNFETAVDYEFIRMI